MCMEHAATITKSTNTLGRVSKRGGVFVSMAQEQILLQHKAEAVASATMLAAASTKQYGALEAQHRRL